MFSELMQKTSLKGKAREEDVRQFIKDRGWDDETMWHGNDHEHCWKKGQGHWLCTGFGFYQASDWQWRWFLGYRCSKCGSLVQFSQITSADNDNSAPVQRHVWLK